MERSGLWALWALVGAWLTMIVVFLAFDPGHVGVLGRVIGGFGLVPLAVAAVVWMVKEDDGG